MKRYTPNQQLAHLLITILFGVVYFSTNLFPTKAANLAINNRTVEDWTVVDLKGANTYKPLFLNNHSVVPHDDVSHWPVNTYYWQAPEPYYQWKIYTYGGDLKFLVSHIVTRGDTSGKYLDEPDLVLEGGPKEHHMQIGYKLPEQKDIREGYDKNQTIQMPLSEPGWYHLVETEDEGIKYLKLGDVPVSRADFSLVLAGLDRSLIRAKYHMDQVEGDLYDVNMKLFNNKSRTIECDNDCSGVLLDDLDDIGLLFDEIRRLAPMLKDGPWRRLAYLNNRAKNLQQALSRYLNLIALGQQVIENYALNFDKEALADILELSAIQVNSKVSISQLSQNNLTFLNNSLYLAWRRTAWSKTMLVQQFDRKRLKSKDFLSSSLHPQQASLISFGCNSRRSRLKIISPEL